MPLAKRGEGGKLISITEDRLPRKMGAFYRNTSRVVSRAPGAEHEGTEAALAQLESAACVPAGTAWSSPGPPWSNRRAPGGTGGAGHGAGGLASGSTQPHGLVARQHGDRHKMVRAKRGSWAQRSGTGSWQLCAG